MHNKSHRPRVLILSLTLILSACAAPATQAPAEEPKEPAQQGSALILATTTSTRLRPPCLAQYSA